MCCSFRRHNRPWPPMSHFIHVLHPPKCSRVVGSDDHTSSIGGQVLQGGPQEFGAQCICIGVPFVHEQQLGLAQLGEGQLGGMLRLGDTRHKSVCMVGGHKAQISMQILQIHAHVVKTTEKTNTQPTPKTKPKLRKTETQLATKKKKSNS